MHNAINADLANVDQWYEQNRNTSKYQVIIMGKTQAVPQFYCENTAIPITEDLEMLEVTVDDKMKFEKHTDSKYMQKSLLADVLNFGILVGKKGRIFLNKTFLDNCWNKKGMQGLMETVVRNLEKNVSYLEKKVLWE